MHYIYERVKSLLEAEIVRFPEAGHGGRIGKQVGVLIVCVVFVPFCTHLVSLRLPMCLRVCVPVWVNESSVLMSFSRMAMGVGISDCQKCVLYCTKRREGHTCTYALYEDWIEVVSASPEAIRTDVEKVVPVALFFKS